MKKCFAIIFLLLFLQSKSQYYLRGEIRDEENHQLSNVKIILHSNGYLYLSGNAGGFGIPLSVPTDSVTFSLDGYESLTALLDARQYQQIILKRTHQFGATTRRKLLSLPRNFKPEDWNTQYTGGESYSSLVENDFLPSSRFPEIEFSININKASYSNVRRFINWGSTIPPDAVRIEEMLNYFNFEYTNPPLDSVFQLKSTISDCPWNEEHQLLFLNVCARKVNMANIPPSNLVFLIDVSGSMDMPNRLPLLKSAFKLLVNNLREIDTVSIIVYGGTVGIVLQPTSGSEKQKISQVIEELTPGGSTPGESGIRTAYRVAKRQFIKGGNNRIILATDGDFNVGQSSEEELEKIVKENQQTGIYLTCLGVGMGNYKDSKLEVLAKKGKGNFAYLDDQKEAEKVLVKELTQTLYTVADDATILIHFNKDIVSKYRLIGFDNKLKSLKDSIADLEGGEIGSGYSLMAIVEIEPGPDAYSNSVDSLMCSLEMRYRLPGDSTFRNTKFSCAYRPVEFEESLPSFRFATAVVMFGGLLKKSKYFKTISWNDVLTMAKKNYDEKSTEQKEMVQLIHKARSIYKREKHRESWIQKLFRP